MPNTGLEIDLVDLQNDIAFDNNKTANVYIYKLPKITKLVQIFEKNSHTMLTCSSDVTNDFTSYNIEGIVTTEDGEMISNGTSSSSLAKILRRSKTLSVYTNDYKGKFENDSIYIAIIKEDLDVKKANLKQQNVFYIRNINPTTETPDNIEGMLNPKGNSTLELANIELLEDQFLNARAYFTTDTTYNTKNTSKIIIDIQKQALLNSIKISGKQTNGLNDVVPITTPSNLVPIIFNPISSQDELEIYSPWLDYDFALTFANANKFITNKSISELLKDDRQQKLILDLILTTYAYATDFNFVDYVATGTDAGKIKGDQYIGYSAKQASSLTSKTPLEIMDSIYEKYVRDNPQDEDSDEMRFIQQSIAALSRWINSSRSIGKGNNSFNKIYLPFSLRLFNSLTPEKVKVPNPDPSKTSNQVDSWVLTNDSTKFVLESKYFGFSQNKIINNKPALLNEVKLIQLDRKTIIPFLDDNISVINKLPLPGDIDTKSSKDLKYLFYMNIPTENLTKFFAPENTIDTVIPKGTQVGPINSAFLDYGQSAKDAAEAFALLGYQGDFKSGSLETINSETKIITFATKKQSGIFLDGDNKAYQYLWKPTGKIIPNANGVTKQDLANYLKVPIASIVDFDVSWKETIIDKQNGSLDYFRWDNTISYKITHQRISNLVYLVTATVGSKISALSRKATFDKYSWKNEIDLYSKDPTNPDAKYSLELDLKSSIIELDRMILRQMLGEEITIHINGLSQTIYLHSANDETIGVERILFR